MAPPSSATAIQAAALTGPPEAFFFRHAKEVAAAADPKAEPDEQVAAREGRGRVAGSEADGAGIEHLEELELEGGEGGQGPADARGQQCEPVALGAMPPQGRDDQTEQQGAGHVDRERRPGPGRGPMRGRLGESDPGEGADDAAGVDRRQAAGIESGLAHQGRDHRFFAGGQARRRLPAC